MQKVCQKLLFYNTRFTLFSFRIVLKIPLISNLILFSYLWSQKRWYLWFCYVYHRGEDMCSEVLLAKQRLATHMPFFMIFGVCIKWHLYSFLLTTQKVIFVTLLCISSHKHMCSEVLLAKQRLATYMPFFHDFLCVYNMMFLYSFLSTQNVWCFFETVLYT